MKPEFRFIAAQTEWGAWLEANHGRKEELRVGLHETALKQTNPEAPRPIAARR
jgi:hypothetical protein